MSNSKQRYYAGIGSRKTPPAVLQYMARVAARLALRGYCLRSGAADGADHAFELGCDTVQGAKEIWLPWKGFNNYPHDGYYPSDRHRYLAETVHPAWDRLSQGPQKLHARNVGQILGESLDDPVDFVLCWTPDGCMSEVTRTRETGGTGTAIVLADRTGIPIVNLFNQDAKDHLAQLVRRTV